ncbi:hypothetical protein [Streptomyces sp. NPDC020298]|uniref:hypothetical protein n=1 Tax=unclassified Streptomyces TaxID=2593676 RepID=UPI0033CF26F9
MERRLRPASRSAWTVACLARMRLVAAAHGTISGETVQHTAGAHGRSRRTAALRRGRTAGAVLAPVDLDRGARMVMGLLHGFLLQRVAFGLTDTAGFADDLQTGLIL